MKINATLTPAKLTKKTARVFALAGEKIRALDAAWDPTKGTPVFTVQGKYTAKDQLPEPSKEVSSVTDIWFKIEGVPAKFDKMLLQVDLYRSTDSGWSEYRVATSDRAVFGKGNLWQHSLSLTAPRGTKWAEELRSGDLPPGRYLAKFYIDQRDKLQKDFTAELGEEDFVGQVEVESRWPAGYGQMTAVKFPSP